MSVEYDRLLLFIAMGDMRALEHLYHALYPSAYSLALSITGDRGLAEDIAQDTFVRVFTYARKYSEQGYGRAWVLRITRNLALNALRGAKTVPLESIPELSDEGDSQSGFEDSELAKGLLAGLKPQHRQILILKSKGYTHKEIAKILTTNEATVRWQYSSALKKLRAASETGSAYSGG